MAARRIYVADVRGADTYLRMTWHAEERVVVVSQWDGRVCTAATRVDVIDAPEIIAFLANTLGDAATARQVESPPAPRLHWWRRWTARWRRPRAPVTALPQRQTLAWADDQRRSG
jgi:hypothetical protein